MWPSPSPQRMTSHSDRPVRPRTKAARRSSRASRAAKSLCPPSEGTGSYRPRDGEQAGLAETRSRPDQRLRASRFRPSPRQRAQLPRFEVGQTEGVCDEVVDETEGHGAKLPGQALRVDGPGELRDSGPAVLDRARNPEAGHARRHGAPARESRRGFLRAPRARRWHTAALGSATGCGRRSRRSRRPSWCRRRRRREPACADLTSMPCRPSRRRPRTGAWPGKKGPGSGGARGKKKPRVGVGPPGGRKEEVRF